MPNKLSEYKFRKIACESFINGIRLHFDSILLFQNKSYPTALQISIIALEELSKAEWVHHYYYTSKTNQGFPDIDFEENFLKLLYYHPKKQMAFFARNLFDYSPNFINYVKKGQLENLKQKATYVGLDKINGKVNVNSRVSVPARTTLTKAKKIISLLNDKLIEIYTLKNSHDGYFEINEMDSLLNEKLFDCLKTWKYKSGLKSMKWTAEWRKQGK